MITRFRLESIEDDRETVEEALRQAAKHMMAFLRATQPEDTWELTDNPITPIDKDGRAQMYGRLVFRSTRKEDEAGA